jgi:hypothetical protein
MFDHCYWSYDGYKSLETGLLEATDKRYASQRKLFDDLGLEILRNTFEGYNSTIFTYGQSGSGKTFSLVGHYANAGILPFL